MRKIGGIFRTETTLGRKILRNLEKNTCILSIKEVGGVKVVQSDDEPVSEKSLLHHSPTNLSFPDQPEERFSYHKVSGWNYWFYYSHWRNKVRTPLVA